MSCIHLLYCDKSHYQNFTPPFDIPESWQWVRLGDYVINRDGERVPIASTIRSKQSNKIYDYYGAAGAIDKVDNYIFDERLLLIGEDGANLLSRTKDNAFFADVKFWSELYTFANSPDRRTKAYLNNDRIVDVYYL